MSTRVVNGNSFTEDGWPLVDQAGCTWVTVPGTAVTLQIQNGQPLALLRAWAADWNAYVEPLRDGDSACWTEGNSVLGTPGRNNGSNHLGGTAIDLDWESHPMGPHAPDDPRAGFTVAQVNTINEMKAFYTLNGVQMVWWANDWNTPHDSMHSQAGYDTYGNPATADFIARFIRADGFSTFRRGNVVMPPSDAADVLMRATGISHDKAWEIMVGVINGLRDSECNNVNRIAMWLAQIGHESAGFNATEEYQNGDESTDRWKYKGRTWIQITWQSNYAGLSQWAFGKGLIPTATYFVDNPKKLAEIQYAGLGPAWYWTVARPQINSLCDNRDLVAVTQAINGGQNGAADRKNRYDRALALGDQLLVLTTAAPPTTPGDDMASVPQDQWDRVYRELTQRLPSRSPLRHLDQTAFYRDGLVDTMAGMVLNTDGSEHVQYVSLLAGYGHPPTLALLEEVAGADPARYPDRQDDAKLAQAILADVTSAPVPAVVNNAAAPAAPQIVYVDRPAPLPAVVEEPSSTGSALSTGQIIGKAYDALEALRLADALPIEGRAPLAALIGVLQTKNGSQL